MLSEYVGANRPLDRGAGGNADLSGFSPRVDRRPDTSTVETEFVAGLSHLRQIFAATAVGDSVRQMDKELLRRTLKAQRQRLSVPASRRLSQEICERLVAHASASSGRVLAFHALHGEPDLSQLFEHFWAAGHVVYLPRTSGGYAMDFVPVHSLQELVAGPHGLREPDPAIAAISVAALERGDVMLVPGLAFDRQGWRLGFGAGYYDRYLSRCSEAPRTVGVCFESFVIDEVPHDAHDVPVDSLCTETGWTDFR